MSSAPDRLRRAARAAARCAAVAMIVGGLSCPVPALAQVRRLSLTVADMSSVLYARGVEESIKRLREVARVEVDLASRRVTVEAAEGKSLSIQRVREQVSQAGFKIEGEFDVLAVGRFAIGPRRRLSFRIGGTAQSYQVLENHETLILFRDHSDLQGDFLVGFRLHRHPEWNRTAIALTRVEPWKPPDSQQ